MREIKFRAWNKERKVMALSMILGFIAKEDVMWKLQGAVEEYDWMQYTGLKDKNGVEIYEGDIVKWSINYVLSGIFIGNLGLVEYKSECLAFVLVLLECGKSYLTFHELPLRKDKGFEVIGNIYENPELLKGEIVKYGRENCP